MNVCLQSSWLTNALLLQYRLACSLLVCCYYSSATKMGLSIEILTSINRNQRLQYAGYSPHIIQLTYQFIVSLWGYRCDQVVQVKANYMFPARVMYSLTSALSWRDCRGAVDTVLHVNHIKNMAELKMRRHSASLVPCE